MSRLSLAAFFSIALVSGSGLPALAQTTTWNTAFTGTSVPNGETYVFVDGGSLTPGGIATGTLSIGPSAPSGTSSVLQFSYTGTGTSSAKLTGFGSVIVDGPGNVVITNSNAPQANTFNGNLVLRSGTMIVNASIAGGNGNTIFQGGALQYAIESDWNNQIILTNQGGLFDASRGTQNNSINQTISGTGYWTLIGTGSAAVASQTGNNITYVNPTCNFTGTTTITGGKVNPTQDNVFGDSTQVGGSQANNKVILNGGSLFVPAGTTRNFVTAVEVGANGGYVDTYRNPSGQMGMFTFAGGISGTGRLTLLGEGSVRISSSNAFSGTIVSSTTGPNGSLQLNNVNAIRNAELNWVSGANSVLSWSSSGPFFFGGLSGTSPIDGFNFVTGLDIGGNGRSTAYSGNLVNFQTLTKSGTGTFTYTGTSTLSQGTTITGGVLAVNGNLALGAATLGQSTPSSANVTLNGGTLKQTVAFNAARAFTIQSGGGGIDTSVVGSSAVVNLSGSFTGSGNLTLAANGDLTGSGTGNLALTGANTYTGTTTITSGMVSAASGLGNAANTLVLNGGGLIALSGTRTNSYATVIGLALGTLKASAASDVLNQAAVMSGSGGLRASGNGTVNLQAANTFSGDTRTISGTMNLAHANALQNSLLDMNAADTGVVGFTAGTTTYNVAGLQGSRGITFSSGTLSVGANNASTTYSGPLSGSGRLVKVGSGDFTLTGTNSYSGSTTVSAGRLVGTTDGLQGAITNNAAVEFSQATAGTYAGNMTGSGSLTKTGGGAVTLSGTNNYSGGTVVSAGSVIGTTSSLQGGITNNAGVEFSQATAGTYAGNMTGSGSLTKTGGGAVTLSGTNNYSGGTIVSAGSLIGTTSSLQGGITNNSAVEFAQATAGTYSGNMTGLGSLTKTGGGAVTLSGTNNYSGGTIVSAGSLIGTTSSLQGGITNNAGVEFAQGTSGTYSGVITGSGSLTKSGSGEVMLSGANNYTGGTVVSGGTLAGTATSLLGAVTNNAAVRFHQEATGTYSGQMSGIGSLAKTGAGILALSANNSYTGATAVDAGKLLVNGDQAAATGPMTVAAPAILGGSGTIGGNVTIAGVHSPGNSPGVQTINGNLTYLAGSSITWELTANTTGGTGNYDQIVVPNGNLAFSGSTALDLVFNAGGSGVNWMDPFWDANRTWLLIDLSTGVTSDFNNLVITTQDWADSTSTPLQTSRSGASFSVGMTGQDVLISYFAPVPEPSTLALAAMAGLGALAARRRRARPPASGVKSVVNDASA